MSVAADNRRGQRVAFPIWAKLALFAVMLSVTAIVVIGLVLTDISARTIKASSRDYRLALAEDVAETVSTEVAQSRVDMMTAVDLLGNAQVGPDQRLELLLSFVTSSTPLDHVVVYDASGGRIDAIREAGAPVGEPTDLTAERVAALQSAPGVVVGEVSRANGEPRLALFAAIRPDGGDVTGFVSTRAQLTALARRADKIASERLTSAGSRLVVVDETLARVVGPDDESSLADHALLRSAATLLDKRVAQSGEVDTPGGPRVASVLPLPELRWFVVVEVPTDVAYASLHRMRRGIWIGAFVVFVLALITSLLGARRIARPLKRLTAFAEHLAARRFDERVSVNTSDEVSVLADVMNGAAQQLADSEEQIRRETAIRTDLGRYLPRELVEAVVRREQDLELGGRRAEITVLFADIVQFTPLCESLEPERVVELLNEFFTITTEIVFRHGGTIDKFVGDSVMAFWGAPEPCEDHADRALRAAEDILRWLEVGNERWAADYGVELQVAIGVNSGMPIVGNIGSETRMEYTIIGDVVNVAARLEALARPGQILTTGATRAAADEYEFAAVAEEVVHVGSEPIEILEVLL